MYSLIHYEKIFILHFTDNKMQGWEECTRNKIRIGFLSKKRLENELIRCLPIHNHIPGGQVFDSVVPEYVKPRIMLVAILYLSCGEATNDYER